MFSSLAARSVIRSQRLPRSSLVAVGQTSLRLPERRQWPAAAGQPSLWISKRGAADVPNANYVPPGGATAKDVEEVSKAEAPAEGAVPASEPAAESPKEESATPDAAAKSAAKSAAADPKVEKAEASEEGERGATPDTKWMAILKGTIFGCLIGGGYTALHVELLGKAHLFEGLIAGTVFLGPAVAGILAGPHRAKVVLPYIVFSALCWGVFLSSTDKSVWWIDRPQKWSSLSQEDRDKLEEECKRWGAGDILKDPQAINKKFQLLKDPVSGVITPVSLDMYFKRHTSETKQGAMLIEMILISLMDNQHNQMMSFYEFASCVILLKAMAEGDDEARYRSVFKVLDMDNSGFIVDSELLVWVRFLMRNGLVDPAAWGDLTAEEVVQKYVEKYDQDKDGKIAYAEFARLGPMLHFGAWMKEKGLAQWLLADLKGKDGGSVGQMGIPCVRVSAI